MPTLQSPTGTKLDLRSAGWIGVDMTRTIAIWIWIWVLEVESDDDDDGE